MNSTSFWAKKVHTDKALSRLFHILFWLCENWQLFVLTRLASKFMIYNDIKAEAPIPPKSKHHWRHSSEVYSLDSRNFSIGICSWKTKYNLRFALRETGEIRKHSGMSSCLIHNVLPNRTIFIWVKEFFCLFVRHQSKLRWTNALTKELSN